MKALAVAGARCYYDTFAGPIKAILRPVVLAHNGTPEWLTLELTETVGAYAKGEIIAGVPLRYAVPRDALKVNSCGVFYILPYAWTLA
jgi:hypothetical protein